MSSLLESYAYPYFLERFSHRFWARRDHDQRLETLEAKVRGVH
jgi:hypothetical protein